MEWLAAVADLVVPRTCPGCGTSSASWCAACAGELLGELVAFGGVRPVAPSPSPPGFPPCFAAGAYAGRLACVIRAHKDGDRADAAGLLAALLRPVLDAAVAQLVATGAEDPLVVPAPSRGSSVRHRGRDPLGDVVRRAAAGRWPVLGCLAMRRGVRDQAGLDARARAANLAGAVVMRPAARGLVSGRPVVLVDDVVTTGATLSGSTEALRGAGASVVVAVVLSARRRRNADEAPLSPRGVVG